MIIIRKAKKEDLEDAKKLLSIKEVDWDETYSSEYFERLINTKEGAIFSVAEENKEIVGVVFGEYSVKENWSELMGIVVKKNFRGKGIGKILIKKFEEIIKNKNVSMVELQANTDTLGKFIHKLGYRKSGTFVHCRKYLK